MTYNRFIQGLKAAGVEVDRKILADLAVTDAAAFTALVEIARAERPGRGAGASDARLTPRRSDQSSPAAERWPPPVRPRPSASAPGCAPARSGRCSSPKARRRSARRSAGGPTSSVTSTSRTRRPSGMPTSSPPQPTPGLSVQLVDRRGAGGDGRRADPAGPAGRLPDPASPTSTRSSPPAPVVGVLAHVRDPGNAGTVIRAADAAGADAVVVSDGSVDAYAPKVVRSTAGSLFHLPVVSGMPVPAIVERCGPRASPSSQRTVPGTAPSTRPTSDGRTPGCSATRRGD